LRSSSTRGERLLHAAVLLAGSHADGLTTAQAAREILWEHVETTMRPASESSVLNLFTRGR
jgi:hypothetical protein